MTGLAVFTEVTGNVIVLSRDTENPGRVSRWLQAGQGLRVGPAGRAVLRYSDDTVLELAEGSHVKRLGEAATGKTVELATGSVTARVARQPVGSPMRIRSPLAQATILGTTLTFSATADSASLEVWSGRVRLKRASDGRSIDIKGGQRGIVAPGKPFKAEPLILTRSFQDGVLPDSGYSGTRDTHINQVMPRETAGTLSKLEADGDEVEGESIYSLLRWDLSSIPNTAVVRSAALTLHVRDTSKKATGYALFAVSRPWVESEATWIQYAAGRPWQSSGARGGADRSPIILATLAPEQEGQLRIPLNAHGVALVQSWIRHPDRNFGLLIGNDRNSDGFKFSSRESSETHRRPKLTVTYAPGRSTR